MGEADALAEQLRLCQNALHAALAERDAALREAARYEPVGWMCARYEGAVAHRDHGNCDPDECEPLYRQVTEAGGS